jgi:hypothetical protein
MVGGESCFLHRRPGYWRLEFALGGVGFLPRGPAGTIGRGGFGEIIPVMLHAAGKRELLVEERSRDGDWRVEKALQLGSVRGATRESDQRQEILRRVFVVEFISGERHELGQGQVRAKGRAGEDGSLVGGGEGRIGGYKQRCFFLSISDDRLLA